MHPKSSSFADRLEGTSRRCASRPTEFKLTVYSYWFEVELMCVMIKMSWNACFGFIIKTTDVICVVLVVQTRLNIN